MQESDQEKAGGITGILEAIQRGDPNAGAEMFAAVYAELRRLAARKMANEFPGHTLQATALVNEAWLRLTSVKEQQHWQNRGHFFAAAGEAMRRILVESARRKHRLKRGGGHLERMDIDSVDLPAPMPDDELLALDEALTRLATIDDRAAELVKLRFFVGLTQEQASKEMGISISTVERTWAFARAWLFREIQKGRKPGL